MLLTGTLKTACAQKWVTKHDVWITWVEIWSMLHELSKFWKIWHTLRQTRELKKLDFLSLSWPKHDFFAWLPINFMHVWIFALIRTWNLQANSQRPFFNNNKCTLLAEYLKVQILVLFPFLIYINDLPNCLEESVPSLLTDDTNISMNGTPINQISNKLNSEINKVGIWL